MVHFDLYCMYVCPMNAKASPGSSRLTEMDFQLPGPTHFTNSYLDSRRHSCGLCLWQSNSTVESEKPLATISKQQAGTCEVGSLMNSAGSIRHSNPLTTWTTAQGAVVHLWHSQNRQTCRPEWLWKPERSSTASHIHTASSLYSTEK